MSKLKGSLLLIITLLILLVFFPLNVQATDSDGNSYATTDNEVDSHIGDISIILCDVSQEDKAAIKTFCMRVDDKIHNHNIWNGARTLFRGRSRDGYTNLKNADTSFLTVKNESDITIIYVNMSDFNKLRTFEKYKVIDKTVEALNENKDLSYRLKIKIFNELRDINDTMSRFFKNLAVDVQADYKTAYEGTFGKVEDKITGFTGFVVLMIILFLGLTIVLDLAYINVPAIQIVFDEFTDKGKTYNANLLISRDARSAVKMTDNTTDSFINANSTYFKSRAKQCVLLSILLILLITGNLYVVLGSIIDTVFEIVRVFMPQV